MQTRYFLHCGTIAHVHGFFQTCVFQLNHGTSKIRRHTTFNCLFAPGRFLSRAFVSSSCSCCDGFWSGTSDCVEVLGSFFVLPTVHPVTETMQIVISSLARTGFVGLSTSQAPIPPKKKLLTLTLAISGNAAVALRRLSSTDAANDVLQVSNSC